MQIVRKKKSNKKTPTKKPKHDRLLLLFESVSGVFAHGQLHILNVIFRLTAVCEIALSNKKDKLNAHDSCECFLCRAAEPKGRRGWRR